MAEFSSCTSFDIANKVLNVFSIPVNVEDIEENKEFGTLLLELCKRLTDEDGVSKEQKEAEKKLKESKIAYFEQQIIHNALQDIFIDHKTSAHKSFISEEDKILSNLSKRIANVEICNRLEDSTHEEKLLGLTSELMMKTSPEVNEAEVHEVLIPKIEEIVFKKCKLLLQYYGINASDKLVFAKIQQLPLLLEADLKTLEQQKKNSCANTLARLTILQNYHQVLLEGIELLQELCMKHRIGTHKNYYSQKAEYLSNKAHGLLLKLRIWELKLLRDTYTEETLPALHLIRNKLQEEETVINKELEKATATLEMYEKVGPSFRGLVNEYTQLLQQIENKKWALQNL